MTGLPGQMTKMNSQQVTYEADNSVDCIQQHHFSGPKSPSGYHLGGSKSFHYKQKKGQQISLSKLLGSDYDKKGRKMADSGSHGSVNYQKFGTV